jgi:redox-sensitive bicupin YhaK (pirin superfamily)
MPDPHYAQEFLMENSFVLRAAERGHERILSTGPTMSYVGGHPNAFITRHSSFNFHDYQEGRPGFGRLRVFGDETFHSAGCSYNMHPHHNFIICAFVLSGRLTHVNTAGNNDELSAGDFYAFSAGSGGHHTEINARVEPMQAIYIWMLPNRLLLPPSYNRAHFDAEAGRNRITRLLGEGGELPLPQDAAVSRLVSDRSGRHIYRPRSAKHGVYAFVLEGSVKCGDTVLECRDSKAVWSVEEVAYETTSDRTDVLLVETIM